jgi:hypothetical protein
MTGEVQIFDGDELKTSATALHPVGVRGITRDGRVYRYAKAGGSNLAPGKLAVAAAQAANHENIVVASNAAIGATSVTATLGATAATVNQYAGGWLVVNDATGEGIAYPISGHPAADASAALTVKLAKPIQVALVASTSEVSLVMNPWNGAVISVTDQLDMPVGIPNVTIAASEYGWIQTRGVCAALADETLAIGEMLTIGTGVAGAVEEIDAIGEALVGNAIQAGVDTEYRAIYLQID